MTQAGYIINRQEGPLSKRGTWPFLRHLDLELTHRCNNNCIHCWVNIPADAVKATKAEMPTEVILQLLVEAKILGCSSVRFTGGEPLIRQDFEEIFRFAKKLRMNVFLLTNATRLTPRLAKLLKTGHPGDLVEVTAYGMKRCSYEEVSRFPGSYEAFCRGIRLLQKNDVPFSVKSALLPPNREEIDLLEAWTQTLPATQAPGFSMTFDLRVRRDSPGKNRIIQSLRASPDEVVSFYSKKALEHADGITRFCSTHVGPHGSSLFSCGGGYKMAAIDPYGALFPCLCLRHPQATYELKSGSLTDAVTRFLPELRKMNSQYPPYLKRCAKCFLHGLCEQCPGKSWIEHGTFDTPVEYLCQVAHSQAQSFGLIKNGERGWEVRNWRKRIRSLQEQTMSPPFKQPLAKRAKTK